MPESRPEQTPSSDASPISEERVHAALRRAAQLQAEAADRLEQQARARIQAHSTVPSESGAYLREHVEAAAVEAGISAEYIRQALLEQEALGEHATELAPWVDQMGNRMLGTRQRSIDLSRTIDAEPSAVFEAMQRIFPAHPYGMTLVDSIGGLPLEGGILVFQIPKMSMGSTASTPFSYTATAVDLPQLHVSLRPVKLGQKAACEVTLQGDLRTSTRSNVWVGIAVSGLGGGVGGVMGTIATLAAGVIFPVAALAGGAVGVACFGAAGAAGYGAMYRYYLRKMIRELETLLKVVDTSARTGGAFRPPQPSTPASATETFTMISS